MPDTATATFGSVSLQAHAASLPRAFPTYARRFGDVCQYGVDRILAKLAFHSRKRYQRLASRACRLAAIEATDDVIAKLRRLDPSGMGIWYLAHTRVEVDLVRTCERVINLPRVGPPRPVARLLHQSLAGDSVCWFGESGGFQALAAETLVVAGLTAALTALSLASEQPDWLGAQHGLTRAAAALQTATRAYRRVMDRPVGDAELAGQLIFQAVNTVRRAMNRTDRFSVEEQLADEAVRLAERAARAACVAALALIDPRAARSASPPTGVEGLQLTPTDRLARERLAALVRSSDAWVSRVASVTRLETDSPDLRQQLVDQAEKLLADASKVLRPWGIQLQPRESRSSALMVSSTPEGESHTVASTEKVATLCARASDLVAASADTQDAWAVLHQNLPTFLPTGNLGDEWAVQLVRTVAGRVSGDQLCHAVRTLVRTPERAVASATIIAALQECGKGVRRRLWRVVRERASSNVERTLAFQLYWRLEARRPRLGQ